MQIIKWTSATRNVLVFLMQPQPTWWVCPVLVEHVHRIYTISVYCIILHFFFSFFSFHPKKVHCFKSLMKPKHIRYLTPISFSFLSFLPCISFVWIKLHAGYFTTHIDKIRSLSNGSLCSWDGPPPPTKAKFE